MRNVESIEVGYGEALQFGVSQGTYYKEPEQLLTEAYEAGKRDAIPEGWVLVPKDSQWFLEFVREWDHFKHMGVSWLTRFYKAMLAAAPKGEE